MRSARPWLNGCARETEGEVLFDTASRGRYATDASIYQIMPVGVLVPQDRARRGHWASHIARDLKVPVLARGGGTSQCGQTTGAALVIDNSKYLRQVLNAGCGRPAPPEVRARPGAGPSERTVETATACGTRWMSPPARRPRWAAWPATTPAAHARSPTATWCTTWSGASAWLSDGAAGRLRPGGDATCRATGRRAGSPTSCAGSAAHRTARSIAARWPKVLRRVGGYNLDIFDNQNERPYTERRQREPGAPAGRLRGHARRTPAASR